MRSEPKKAVIMKRKMAKGAYYSSKGRGTGAGDPGDSTRGYAASCKVSREIEEVGCRGKEI